MSPSSSPSPLRRTALAVALFLATTGCSHTKVSRVWSDAELKEDRYQKVMVLVIARSHGRRQTAEDRIVAELKGKGSTAVRSWDVLAQDEVGDRERIRQAVEASGADALLAVRVTSVDRERQMHEGREQWVPVATGVDYYGYLTTSYGLYRRPDTSEILTVTAETTLWDLASRRMVWACQSDFETANQTITTAELADDYARVVTKKVRPYLRGR